METRIALIGIVVEDLSSTARMNEILHQYGNYILGRMGIPRRERGISILSVVVEAPGSVISALSGKLGMLPGIQTKTIYSAHRWEDPEEAPASSAQGFRRETVRGNKEETT